MSELINETTSNSAQNTAQPPVTDESQQPLSHTTRKKFIRVFSIMLLFIIIGGIAFYLLPIKNTAPIKKITAIVNSELSEAKKPQATPTPMPFVDMTIPYLREQTYQSALGELEFAYDGSNYTAFTTTYTSGGLKINGLLTKPTGDEPSGGWPAIVFVHGYIPPASYQTLGEAYSSYVDYLASNGYVVFKIDLRGHGDSEGEPGGAYYSSDYITDTLSAYAALENTPFINKEKIGLWGHSMAGNVLMRSWATKKNIPAIVIWAGAVYTYEDMIKYRITDASYQPQPNSTQRMRRRQEMYEKYGSPSANVTFWQQVAPVSYLDELNGALQLHHAVDDDVVNVAYSRDLNTLVQKTSIPHEFYEYSSGGHNISGDSFNEAMQRTVLFYDTYLK